MQHSILTLLFLLNCAPQSSITSNDTIPLDIWYTTEEKLPYVGKPSCGIVNSDFTTELHGENDLRIGPLDWKEETPLKIQLSYEGLSVGSMEWELLDPEWKIAFRGLGIHKTVTAEEGCPF